MTLRAVLKDNQPWFIAKDACAAIYGQAGAVHPSKFTGHLDADEKGVGTVDTLGGPQSLSIINESGLYSLILKSRKPEAPHLGDRQANVDLSKFI